MQLLFAHLNLTHNPFGEATPESRAAMAVVETDQWLQRVDSPCHAVQFIGDSGRGKSTHLIALYEAYLDQPDTQRTAARLRITEGEPPPPWPDAELLFVDEIQAAPKRHRAALFRSERPLVLGTHRDLSRELRRFNYTVMTRHLRNTDAPTIHEMFRRRIEHARRAEGPVPEIPHGTVETLIRKHGDNVRAMESELYDVFQTITEPTEVNL